MTFRFWLQNAKRNITVIFEIDSRTNKISHYITPSRFGWMNNLRNVGVFFISEDAGSVTWHDTVCCWWRVVVTTAEATLLCSAFRRVDEPSLMQFSVNWAGKGNFSSLPAADMSPTSLIFSPYHTFHMYNKCLSDRARCFQSLSIADAQVPFLLQPLAFAIHF